MTPRSEWRFTLAGWLLFTASAGFFTWASMRAGERVAIAGSLLFLIACIVFLVPVWRTRPPRD